MRFNANPKFFLKTRQKIHIRKTMCRCTLRKMYAQILISRYQLGDENRI